MPRNHGLHTANAPTLSPDDKLVQYQRWEHLLFLHWPVPAAVIQPLLPTELDIDTFDGQAFIGLVPFTMRGVRPTWAPPIRALSDFHETNVRTYVRHRGTHPGVWFFSLDATNPIAVSIARTFWQLPYYHSRMSLRCSADGTFTHNTHRRAHTNVKSSVVYRPTGSAMPAPPGTLAHFLVERYCLYTRTRAGHILRGRVHHTPYPLQGAVLEHLDETLLAAANVKRPDVCPLVHYARGVTVDVFNLKGVTC